MTFNVIPKAAVDNTIGGVFNKFKTPLQQIYNGIKGIATLVAAVGFAICSVGMMASKNQRTVEEFKAWRTRIMITWLVLMMLGVIVNLGESITNDMGYDAK